MRFLVIGEQCTDVFIYGSCSRLSPEAPVPVFNPISNDTNPGMAANVVANLKSLIEKGTTKWSLDHILSKDFSRKVRYVDQKTNHYFLRVDEESECEPIVFGVREKDLIPKADCIIISDYDKGFITEQDLVSINKRKKRGAVVFMDTKKKISLPILENIDFLKLNERESKSNLLPTHKKKFSSKIIVTLGEKGAMRSSKVYHMKDPVNTIDVSGAGDTFLATLAYSYMISNDIGQAIQWANEKASEVVKKRGVAIV